MEVCLLAEFYSDADDTKALRSSVLAAICLDPNAGLTAELQVLLPDDQPLQAQKTVPDTFAAALLLPIELHTLASHTKVSRLSVLGAKLI